MDSSFLPLEDTSSFGNLTAPKPGHRLFRKGSTSFYIRFLFLALGSALVFIALAAALYGVATARNELMVPTGVASPPLFPGCGRQSSRKCEGNCSSRTRRLVGGLVVKNAWPWMAVVLVGGQYKCGGVVISESAVLTAAHCLFKEGKAIGRESVTVYLGITDRRHLPPSSLYFVKSVIVHSGFNPANMQHDIALIKLKRSIDFRSRALPICLPSAPLTMEGSLKLAKVTGWGRKFEDGNFMDQLQEISVPLVRARDCKQSNEGIFKGVHVNEQSNICAGFGGGRMEYGCNGDSGGPLMLQSKDGQWTLLGVMSWGDPTCLPGTRNSYIVFSRVEFYQPWIADQLRS